MRLTAINPGQKARVMNINKGCKAERRMFEMGIRPGVEIELVSKHLFNGPLLFKVGQTQIALGRNLAEAIEVEV
ncbi:MAG: FeoA family protein [Syntrophomonas sp.]